MDTLIKRLKERHQFSDEIAQKVSMTFMEFIKEVYPNALPHLEGLIVSSPSDYPADKGTAPSSTSYIPDEALKNNTQLSKDKQSGFYEGNKKDY